MENKKCQKKTIQLPPIVVFSSSLRIVFSKFMNSEKLIGRIIYQKEKMALAIILLFTEILWIRTIKKIKESQYWAKQNRQRRRRRRRPIKSVAGADSVKFECVSNQSE